MRYGARVPIRPTALAVVRRGSDLLVTEAIDDVKEETFYRLLGGGIEFGEPAEQAVRREFREELDAELTGLSLLGVVENIFDYRGQPGHEIVFVFEGALADRGWYEREDLGKVLDTGQPVSWQPMARFVSGEAPLYPASLLRLLGVD